MRAWNILPGMPGFTSRLFAAATATALMLTLPPLRGLLESSMTLHMLLQLPLLALLGYAIGVAWRSAESGWAARSLGTLQEWNAGGATGIIVASFVMLLWMLPRGLDTAQLDWAWDTLKILTVMMAGVAVAISWPRLPAIARGVIHLEVIATLLRFGWGYIAAKERLCLVYLAGDQARAGEYLLWAGALYAVVVAWKPLFGDAHRR